MRYEAVNTPEERLERLTTPVPWSGCLLWLGTINTRGYGQIYIGKRNRLAHRVAWELVNGPVPDGKWVLHKCDVRCCLNVAHMFLGDHAANMADMAMKRRGTRSRAGFPCGVQRTHAKTTRFDARVKLGGTRVNLGTYATVEEASAAVVSAQQAYWSKL